MRPHEGIEENLRFLIIEVDKQLDRTARYLRQPNKALVRKVAAADDYIDNLKTNIQRKSFVAAAHALDDPSDSVDTLRTYEVIAGNLERVADFCEKVLDQVGHIDHPQVRERYDLADFLAEVKAGVALIERAVFERDTRVALGICRTEHTLDQMYSRTFRQVLDELKAQDDGEETQSLVTMLFIAHYLERMGDALLNIGESILSSQLGERIKIGQLRTLETSLDKTNMDAHLGHLSLSAMGETKSGARVASLSSRAPEPARSGPRSVIFKEGKTKKLIEERDSIARWEQLMPGLAPKIYSFHQDGEDGAILFEYLPGSTFESMLLTSTNTELSTALLAIQGKLLEIWSTTRTPTPSRARFLHQLSSRLDDVLAVHPEFEEANSRIAKLNVPCFTSLVDALASCDEELFAPFSVFIHGDFNVDNVIFEATRSDVRFIDLHRSTMMDYVQDVSVFMVSHFRLQHLDAPVRRRVNSVILKFHEFACDFASSVQDDTFHERLALGIARSMTTSTRFVLDHKLSAQMFLRSRYLLERMVEAREKQQRFHPALIKEVLID